MLELLEWAQLSGKKGEMARNISNTLFILYFLSYLLNKKSFYIGAFLLIELLGASSLMDWSSNAFFYLMYASLYSLCYYYQLKIGKNFKILCAYGVMVLFQTAMVLDAYFHKDIVTHIYQSYNFVVMCIHIYIITVLVEPRELIKTMVNSISRLSNFLGIGYSLSFCYNVNIIRKKT
jgi:hypothetical protein